MTTMITTATIMVAGLSRALAYAYNPEETAAPVAPPAPAVTLPATPVATEPLNVAAVAPVDTDVTANVPAADTADGAVIAPVEIM